MGKIGLTRFKRIAYLVRALKLMQIMCNTRIIAALAAWCLASLAACDSRGIVPSRGNVSAEYVGMSADDVRFTLTNASTEAVYVRGHRTLTLAIAVWIGDQEFSCRAKPGDAPAIQYAGIAHGGPEPRRFEVSPGDRVRLVFPTRFPQQHKGSLCQLRLTLGGDRVVESNEFVP